MIKKVFITALFAILMPAVFAQNSAKLEIDSAITRVTVYTDRAQICRIAEVELKQGLNAVVFKNLPVLLDENSFRARGIGTNDIKILGIETTTYFVEKPVDEKIRAVEDELEKLGDEDRALLDELAVLSAEHEFLMSIKAQAAEKASMEVAAAQPEVEKYKEVIEYVKLSLSDNSAKVRDINVKRRDIARKMFVKESERRHLHDSPKLEMRNVTVNLEALKPGRISMEFSYVIWGAAWFPKYDLRVMVKEKKVELSYYGFVIQKTGEDWKNVELTLSTAKPSLGAKMPELAGWFLESGEKETGESTGKAGPPFGAGIWTDESSAPQAGDNYELRLRMANNLIANGNGTASNRQDEKVSPISFKIKTNQSIPSDGSTHKTTILVQEFDAAFSYESIPKLSSYAYLKTTLTNTTSYPLLAGTMNIFWASDFVGTSLIQTVAPSEQFDAFLGVDETIKIERKQEKKFADQTGGFLKSTKKRSTFGYRITVNNYQAVPVELVLTDQIPVAQSADIVVELISSEPEPDENASDGKMKWKMNLQPGEKKEIYFEFAVYAPPGREIKGME